MTPAWSWSAQHLGTEIRFVGKGSPKQNRRAALAALLPTDVKGAWLEQVHGADVVGTTVPGCLGSGDALVTAERGLALAVVTADCVPVLLAGGTQIAAVHAGWRGIVHGVVPAAVAQIAGDERLAAWIGPAIGACCYEVSEEVATKVARASAPEVIKARQRGRPHLDLMQAVYSQLTARGIRTVQVVDRCTRCTPDLCSYRRDGPGQGRNFSVIWRL